MAQEAVGLSLLFCDYFIEERNTGKKTLTGTFCAIYGKTFPGQCRPFWIYASFTNIAGEHSFAVNIVFEKTQNVLLSMGGNFSATDKDAIIEFPFPVNTLMLPEPGKCQVTLHIDGSVIMSRTLYIKEIPNK